MHQVLDAAKLACARAHVDGGNRVFMSEVVECRCPCHGIDEVVGVHMAPCCVQCPSCQRNIKMWAYTEHHQICKNQVRIV